MQCKLPLHSATVFCVLQLPPYSNAPLGTHAKPCKCCGLDYRSLQAWQALAHQVIGDREQQPLLSTSSACIHIHRIQPLHIVPHLAQSKQNHVHRLLEGCAWSHTFDSTAQWRSVYWLLPCVCYHTSRLLPSGTCRVLCMAGQANCINTTPYRPRRSLHDSSYLQTLHHAHPKTRQLCLFSSIAPVIPAAQLSEQTPAHLYRILHV